MVSILYDLIVAYLFANRGIVLSYGEFQAFYTVDLLKSHTPSEIAWIGSTQAFVLLLLGFFSGPLFDMGYFRLCIWSGTIITVFGLMMTSLGGQTLADSTCTRYRDRPGIGLVVLPGNLERFSLVLSCERGPWPMC